MIQEFRDFIFRGNVVDLAVAVVIGGAFAAITVRTHTEVVGVQGTHTAFGTERHIITDGAGIDLLCIGVIAFIVGFEVDTVFRQTAGKHMLH